MSLRFALLISKKTVSSPVVIQFTKIIFVLRKMLRYGNNIKDNNLNLYLTIEFIDYIS